MHLVAGQLFFLCLTFSVLNILLQRTKRSWLSKKLDTLTNFLLMGLFYLNVLILIPQLFYKKKYALYHEFYPVLYY